MTRRESATDNQFRRLSQEYVTYIHQKYYWTLMLMILMSSNGLSVLFVFTFSIV